MSCSTTVDTILKTEYIGNSLDKINGNFSNLVTGVCNNEAAIGVLQTDVTSLSALPSGAILQVKQTIRPSSDTLLYQPYTMSRLTTPQITEGIELVSVTITPKLPNSSFLLTAMPVAGSNGPYTNYVVQGLFRAGVSDALVAKTHYSTYCEDYMFYMDSPGIGNTNPITYSIRIGSADGTSVNVNDVYSETGKLGTARKSVLIVQEVRA